MNKSKSRHSPPSECSDSSRESENTYCVFLHTVEGINFYPKNIEHSSRAREKIIMSASLNGVRFEVEGNSNASETTIFNSNCIWECNMAGIKRIKTDNRPVKLEFSSCSGRDGNVRKSIGNLLLPLRGLPLLSNLHNINVKFIWHKLSCLATDWRKDKPEIYLQLSIVKKTFIDSGEFEALLTGNRKSTRSNCLQSAECSQTAFMLQSQSNIYVQLLEQVGLLQIGNQPDIDCDIIEAYIVLKELKFVNKLIPISSSRSFQSPLIISIDFVGNVTNIEIDINDTDCYELNEKIGFKFKTSLQSMRAYFQKIFYLPISLYCDGVAIASYRVDFCKLLPDESHFDNQPSYGNSGRFYFDRLHKMISPRIAKPAVDYTFHVDIKVLNSNRLALLPSAESEDMLRAGDSTKMLYNTNMQYPDLSKTNIHINLHANILTNDDQPMAIMCEQFDPLSTEPGPDMVRPLVENILKTLPEKILSMESLPVQTKSTTSVTRSSVSRCKDASVGTDVPFAGTLAKCSDNAAISSADMEVYVEQSNTAVNTEPVAFLDDPNTDLNELHFNIVQELELWKADQMDLFVSELEHKEFIYMQNLNVHWRQQHTMERYELDSKLAKCKQLESKLTKIHKSLFEKVGDKEKNITLDSIKRSIEEAYEAKFKSMEKNITLLKSEMESQVLAFANKNNRMRAENLKLAREKIELMERIGQMEAQLAGLKEQSLCADELKSILDDMRKQNERYISVQQAKDFYKKKWGQTTRKIHKLKLKILEKQQQDYMAKGDSEAEFCLRDIITGEQTARTDECTDLREIKMALAFSDSSTSEGEEIISKGYRYVAEN